MKRDIARCTILLLIPAIVLLTGCGNDKQVDSGETAESVETTENTETIENVESDGESIENDVVDITYDEAETQEEAVSDSEKVYELFLNGELTVELEEEQVTIDELFWNNDIEYCFGDMDGDGSEELHIRDDVVYYAIKARDGMLQILFEGWWSYEPVVTNEVCGILHFTDNKYNYETIQFITINTDGSTESDGEFWWFDESKNGIMDEEDAYRNYSPYEEIDMGQYVQYREEQIAKQTENVLEWTEKRLKDFETWQEAYIDFLSKPTVWVSKDWPECSLVYVDNDEVPELYIEVGGAAGGTIVSFYDGNVRAMNRDRGGIQYIEYGGLFYSDWGNTGFYPCDVYVLEKGEFSEIGTEWISENNDAEKGFLGFDYFWEGRLMTETEYKECLNKLIDTSQCIRPDEVYTKDEILEILEEWEGNRE